MANWTEVNDLNARHVISHEEEQVNTNALCVGGQVPAQQQQQKCRGQV